VSVRDRPGRACLRPTTHDSSSPAVWSAEAAAWRFLKLIWHLLSILV
jgi:hypothetical protein